ncbi:MAG: hypothetical protein J6Y02_01765 [Pseudobutyrivibrio sp.]|nr:hypothetical protein [Pseudobutyrivibrio sp.]
MKTKLTLLLALLALCCTGSWATVTQPTLTTDVNNPIYYKIGSYDRGGYLTYNGSSSNLTHEEMSPDALWYFVQNGEGVSIVPAADPTVKLVTHSSANATGAVWYLVENPYNAGYFCVSRNSDLSANCLDANNADSGVGYYQPSSNDWKGTSWSITQVSNEDVTTLRSSYSTNQMTPAIPKGKVISFGAAATSFTVASSADDNEHWYVMTQTKENAYGGVLETPIWNSSTGSAIKRAPTSVTTTTLTGDLAHQAETYMVRFISAGEGLYKIQFADGTFVTSMLTTGTRNTNAESFAFYNTQSGSTTFGWNKGSKAGNRVDNNGADATIVYWESGENTATEGNNVWFIYPVSFSDFAPDASKVYTFNNTNTSRGAMMYYPTGSSKYVWSSGKGNAAFVSSEANCQWIIKPTGTSGQYYLYNIGAQKFAIPSAATSTASWIFSSNAVPVTLAMQSDGSYKFITASGSVYCAVSNGFDGPIINYNDVGGNFTISKVGDTSSDVTTQVTTAANKLIDNQTSLSADISSEGWYAIKIKSRDSKAGYANNYLYTLVSEYNSGNTYYPLAHASAFKLRPAIDDATYYFRINKSGDKYIWQMPNGKYLINNAGKYPQSTVSETYCNYIKYNQENGYFHFRIRYIDGGYYYDYYADAYDDFIGETGTADRTKYEIYPINLTTAGLTAWQVIIDATSTATQVTCSRSDVSGLSTVYNNGYIFLPTGVTPAGSDFSVSDDEGTSFGIDSSSKTITAANYTTLIDNYLSSNNVSTNVGNAGKAGYPLATNENAVALSSLLETISGGTKNATVYNNLKTWYSAYLAETSVVLPEVGKFYTIYQPTADKYIHAVTPDNNTSLIASADGTAADAIFYVPASGHFLSYTKGYAMSTNKIYNGYYGDGGYQTYTIDHINTHPFGALRIKSSSNWLYTTSSISYVDLSGYGTETSKYWQFTEVTSLPITISSVGYATFYAPVALEIPAKVTAYVATDKGDYISLTAIEGGIIPANTGVILAGEAGSYNFNITTGGSVGSNALTGTVAAIARPADSYVLATGEHGVALYKDGATKIPGFKAYLAAPSGGSVKAFRFDDDDATAINSLTPILSEGEGAIYNIAGQRLSKIQKGVNIINGKKVLK